MTATLERLRALAGSLRRRVALPTTWVGRVELAATILLIAFGAWLRLRGTVFGTTIGFWTDEANWAMRLIERPLSEHLIRPVLFMALTKLSISIFGYTELGFRMLPLLFGIASPIAAAFLGRRYLASPGARLLLVGVISLSFTAIDYAKEFKPYAISIFFHLLLPLLALRWVQTRTRRDLILVGIAAPLAVCFCQDVLFLYPGLFLVLAWEAFHDKNWRQLLVVAGFAVLTLSIVGGMYLFFWKRVHSGRDEYWGDKYGVFYLSNKSSGARVDWVWRKYVDIAESPGDRREVWKNKAVSKKVTDELEAADRLIWFFLHVIGVIVVFGRRKYREGLLFWSPLLVCGVFNFIGLWPWGAFRTNLFTIAGMSALAALAIDRQTKLESIWRALVPVTLLVVLPLAVFEGNLHKTKRRVSSPRLQHMLDHLLVRGRELDSKQELVVLQRHAYNPMLFYTRYHPDFDDAREEIQKRFRFEYIKEPPEAFALARKEPRGSRTWLIFNRTRPPLPRDLVEEEQVRMADQLLYRVRSR